jgi:hypothetical protein
MPKTKPLTPVTLVPENDVVSIGRAAVGYLIGALLVCIVGIVSMATASRRHQDDMMIRHNTTNTNIIH